MGVSEDTGTDFYLFIENAFDTTKKEAAFTTFNNGTELLNDAHVRGLTLHGRKFSKFQLDGEGKENEIKKSYHENTEDGGLRRLTTKEWTQVKKVFQLKLNLYSVLLGVCPEGMHLQSASTCDDEDAYFEYFPNGDQYYAGRENHNAFLLVGYSDIKQKL
jgi:hypothetical protein